MSRLTSMLSGSIAMSVTVPTYPLSTAPDTPSIGTSIPVARSGGTQAHHLHSPIMAYCDRYSHRDATSACILKWPAEMFVER